MSTPCMVVQIPGPTGPAGADGADGTNGLNAYTTTTLGFAMPAEGANIAVAVGSSAWMAVGQKVFLGDPAGAAKGTFQVISLGTGTCVLQNIAVAASGIYPDNSGLATAFPIGTKVSPAGMQGPAGADGTSGAPDDATYLTQTADGDLSAEYPLDILNTGFLHVTNGTGADGTTDTGIADNELVSVDQLGGLIAGDAAFATANGIETKTAANARTALGLVLGVANTNIAPVNDGAGLTTGEFLRATASGIESINDATAKAQLGISGGVVAWAVYQNQQATTVNGGTFTQGSWVVVPLNTEVVDTGSNGAIAANTVTLAAGTYRARWRVPAYQVEEFQSLLYNVDTTTIVGYGCNGQTSLGDTTGDVSCGEARFTLGAPQRLQLWAQCSLTKLNDGFGKANSFGGTEVYATVEFEKEN